MEVDVFDGRGEEGLRSHASLPGLTRQSIISSNLFPKLMDARVKPGHDAECVERREVTPPPGRLRRPPSPFGAGLSHLADEAE
jgi:hypothetical protein